MYVLKRIDQGGGYVAVSGHKTSYTKSVYYMKGFATREEAESNRCVENEVIVDLNDLIGIGIN